jgi:hypothetical protein
MKLPDVFCLPFKHAIKFGIAIPRVLPASEQEFHIFI